MASSLNASTAGGGGIITTADATGNLDIQSGGSTVVAVTSAGVAVTGSLNTPNTFGFKNRIINGGMVFDQRNAGVSVTPASVQYTVDRWKTINSQSSKFTAQQNAASVTPPTGFTNYLGITSSSSYAVLTGDYFYLEQDIEGYNTADLAWGTANAKTVTFSFWVRSSLTGTFGGAISNDGQVRSYPFTYTISVANTWEQKTITIAGDTTGTWTTDNSAGIRVFFGLGVGTTYSGTAGAWAGSTYVSATGATSVVGTSGATFYITGVQLEKGSTATSFDFRDYGRELMMCQRYFIKWGINSDGGGYTSFGSGYIGSATSANINIQYPVQMRGTPTVAQSNCAVLEAGGAFALTALSTSYIGQQSALVGCTVASGMTSGRAATLNANNNVAGFITASAEL